MERVITARVEDARTRRGDHYADRLDLFLRDNPHEAPGGTVFVGDSITEGFPLDAAFRGRNVINRGISGDTITGVLERLDASVTDLHPRQVYLMIGINNLVWAPVSSIETFAEQYSELLPALRRAAPDAEVFVQSILPVAHGYARTNPQIRELNDRIRATAEREGFTYVDLWPRMTDAEGKLRADYTTDGVHLTLEGYEAWLEVIVPPDQFFEVALGLAPRWKAVHSHSHRIDAVDPPVHGAYPGSRGPNQLIVYTPAYASTETATNIWGTEAVVDHDVVVHLGGNNSPIPRDGFVVSGHGESAVWVSTNLQPGVQVEHSGDEVRCGAPPAEELSPEQRLGRLQSDFFLALADLQENHTSPQTLNAAHAVLADILALKEAGGPIDTARLDRLAARLQDLGAPAVQ
jgi:lysophospholipase L1-like esterase